jgi:hypothetical protein
VQQRTRPGQLRLPRSQRTTRRTSAVNGSNWHSTSRTTHLSTDPAEVGASQWSRVGVGLKVRIVERSSVGEQPPSVRGRENRPTATTLSTGFVSADDLCELAPTRQVRGRPERGRLPRDRGHLAARRSGPSGVGLKGTGSGSAPTSTSSDTDHGDPSPDRKRFLLLTPAFADASGDTIHEWCWGLPARDQRQSRTIQPNPARGMGLRQPLPSRSRPRRAFTEWLQPYNHHGATPPATRASRVTNLSGQFCSASRRFRAELRPLR